MSTFNTPNKQISSLINAGADAQTNLYYVELTGSMLNSRDTFRRALTVRNRDFTFGGLTHGTNQVNYLTVSYDMPTAQLTGTKEFTLTFRVDANFEVYTYLLEQQAKTLSANLGFASNDVPDSTNGGFDVTVYSFKEPLKKGKQVDPSSNSSSFTKIYEFRYCWIKSLSGLTFDYNSPGVQSVAARIGFWDYADPMNLLKSSSTEE